jgi:hypothetical protein
VVTLETDILEVLLDEVRGVVTLSSSLAGGLDVVELLDELGETGSLQVVAGHPRVVLVGHTAPLDLILEGLLIGRGV